MAIYGRLNTKEKFLDEISKWLSIFGRISAGCSIFFVLVKFLQADISVFIELLHQSYISVIDALFFDVLTLFNIYLSEVTKHFLTIWICLGFVAFRTNYSMELAFYRYGWEALVDIGELYSSERESRLEEWNRKNRKTG